MYASLPYHEPPITIILIHSSFLLLLNILNWLLDKILYCGLTAEVLVGVAWGSPGAQLLPPAAEDTIVQLGYLGLLLIVYEGGLSVSFSSLKANLILSSAVAITGISLPIGLSFLLQSFAKASPLQAFAAGAALCSTSLGTTFTVLRTSGLNNTRMGVILSSAAMMDDVVGLVMIQIVSNLGVAASSFDPITVIRPIFVSIAFVIVIPIFCRYLILPATLYLKKYMTSYPGGRFDNLFKHRETALVLHLTLLLGLVTGASYAGTSNLFAAYIAGAVVSWWDEQAQTDTVHQDTATRPPRLEGASIPESSTSDALDRSGIAIYKAYFEQTVERILKPFFFASIGFSIPVSEMFTGSIIWRGIVYSLLMAFGKMLCGIWLLRFSIPKISGNIKIFSLIRKIPVLNTCINYRKEDSPSDDIRLSGLTGNNLQAQEPAEEPASGASNSRPRREAASKTRTAKLTNKSPKKPKSLYPPAIVSCAMVARGEVGFLISSLAQSKGIFDSTVSASLRSSPDIFLIVTWAIFLCTVLGPTCVGFLVRRFRNLEKQSQARNRQEGLKQALGIWL